MGYLKGAKEYSKFKSGGKLTRMQSMRAMCFQCNGEEDSHDDCKGVSCPMYSYRLYKTTRSAT